MLWRVGGPCKFRVGFRLIRSAAFTPHHIGDGPYSAFRLLHHLHHYHFAGARARKGDRVLPFSILLQSAGRKGFMNASGLNKIFQAILLLLAVCLVGAPANTDPKLRFEVTELPAPADDVPVYPTAINNDGVVVGSIGRWWPRQPFKYHNGVLEALPLAEGEPRDINDAGDILVRVYGTNLDRHYLIRASVLIPLPADNKQGLYANKLNNLGVVAGRVWELSAGGGYIHHAGIWSNGIVRPIAPPYQDWWSAASDINDSGVAVGAMQELEPRRSMATMFWEGQTIPLGTLPGDRSSDARAVNNRGDVLCVSLNLEGRRRAFLFRAGLIIDLGTLPGGTQVFPVALNNLGHVVGYVEDAQEEAHPFLYMDGVMHDLTEFIKGKAGRTFLFPAAINDKGQIVGAGRDKSGGDHALLLTPKK
jgi:probable HAF family extracellular repeat protein